jgi:hypothetical protein
LDFLRKWKSKLLRDSVITTGLVIGCIFAVYIQRILEEM